MTRKVVRRTIKVRHSARPRNSAPSGGFFGMLARLNDASSRLDGARRRRR
ncbi:MAG TPA: hypothetical protein VFE47_07900 [Tepidisphaeraceae bacterium]|jgi:hypothetical protein|nr:hypothetical protein [Tepidisphaeraceae bacterium]